MYNNVARNNNITFTSIKPNLRLGEAVLQEFKQEFPYIKSSSDLFIRVNTLQNSGKYPLNKLLMSLKEKAHFLSEQIYDKSFDCLTIGQSCNNLAEFSIKLSQHIKEKNFKANCDLDSLIILNKLTERGANPQNIEIKVIKECFNVVNHFTTVFGLAKDAKVDNPKTWGNKAVIVDAWKGIVMKADDALRYFEQLLKQGKNLQYTFYEDYLKKSELIDIIKK